MGLFSKELTNLITGHEDESVLMLGIDCEYKLKRSMKKHVDEIAGTAQERKMRNNFFLLKNMGCGRCNSNEMANKALCNRVRGEHCTVTLLAVILHGSSIVCGSYEGDVSSRGCVNAAVRDSLETLPEPRYIVPVAMISDAR